MSRKAKNVIKKVEVYSTSNEDSDEKDEGPTTSKNAAVASSNGDEGESMETESSQKICELSEEDEEKMLELSRLPPPALIAYIEDLETQLYELSQREARELSRTKYLRMFSNNRRRSTK
ncbi:uncharacterized protein LOC115633734 [Scaptodrosophila lebanonensis]|uniref:Uncharacterized protein LOC115633734 n=1 Tax=Drosophila lebanonensis TaxID=7225 RepID=A0A6J2UG05_DROLE|nr:uncharacterized protein LOC115633734 [Scaptodrosophila lebanonensis]